MLLCPSQGQKTKEGEGGVDLNEDGIFAPKGLKV